MSSLDHIRVITSDPGPKRTTWRAERDVKDWDSFVTWLQTWTERTPVQAARRDFPEKYDRPFMAATFDWSEEPGGGQRLGVHLVERHVIQLDADNAGDDYLEHLAEVAGFLHLSHTTASHLQDGKGPRWRTLIPLSRPVTPSEYLTLSTYLVDLVGRERFDVQMSTSPAAVSYAPAWDGVEYEEADGPVLDVDGYLLVVEPLEWHPTTSAPDATVVEFLTEHPATGQPCVYGRSALDQVAKELEDFPADDGAGFHQKIGNAGMRFVEMVLAGCWSADDVDRLRVASNHRADPRPKEFDEAIAYGLGKGCEAATNCEAHGGPAAADVFDAIDGEETAPTGGNSWAPVDLADILDGSHVDPEPTVGERVDHVGLFYPGKCHTIASESEGGKTWLMLSAVMTEMEAGHHVVYLDFEDSAAGIVGRLLKLRANPAHLRERFHYIGPTEPLTTASHEALSELMGTYQPTLAVLDGVTEALTMHGLDPNANDDVAKFGRMLPRRLARLGAAVVSLDHVTKATDTRGRYAIGAIHKLNGLDGAAYVLENREPFGFGLTGRSSIQIAKDRPGKLRSQARRSKKDGMFWFGDLVVSHDEILGNTATIEPPTDLGTEDPRPTRLMGEVMGLFESEAYGSAGFSKRAARSNIEGRNEAIDQAIDRLIFEGYITTGTPHKKVREWDFEEGSK